MTEPPRPPGDPYGANDPTSGSTPPPASPPPPPPPPSGGYAPPPPGGYPPPAGGYNPPPGGYNAPPGGYNAPPGGYNAPPPQYGGGTSGIDDRSWNLINHFGGAAGAFLSGGVGGWIAPLIVLLSQGNRSPYLRNEAVKALNFQILWAIIAVVGWATTCIGVGVLVLAAATLIEIIFGIIAGVKASNNEPYNYPMSVQIIK